LAQVTQDDTPVFTTAALRSIVRYGKGLPREVNVLCTNALIAGFTAQQKPITAALVQRLIADSQDRRRIPVWQRGLASSAALALLAGLLWLTPWQGRHEAGIMAPQVMPTQSGGHTAETAGETGAPAVPRQVPEVETNRAERDAQSPALLIQQSEASGG